MNLRFITVIQVAADYIMAKAKNESVKQKLYYGDLKLLDDA